MKFKIKKIFCFFKFILFHIFVVKFNKKQIFKKILMTLLPFP